MYIYCTVNIYHIYPLKYDKGIWAQNEIKCIIRDNNKRRSFTKIANEMKITTRYVDYIYKKYKDNGRYTINKRKNKELNNNDIEIIKK